MPRSPIYPRGPSAEEYGSPDYFAAVDERDGPLDEQIAARETFIRAAIRDGLSETEKLPSFADRTPRTKTVAQWTAWAMSIELDGDTQPRDLDVAQLVRWAVTAQDKTQSDVARQLAKSNIVSHVIRVVDETIKGQSEDDVDGREA